MLRIETEQGSSRNQLFLDIAFDFFPADGQFTCFFRFCFHIGLNRGKRPAEGVVQQHAPFVFHFDRNSFGRRFSERYIRWHILVFDRNLDIYFILLLQALEEPETESQQYKTEKDQGFFPLLTAKKSLNLYPGRLECLFD